MMAGKPSSRSSWLGVHEPKFFSSFSLRILRRWYASTCHHIFLPLAWELRSRGIGSMTRRRKFGHNTLQVIAVLLLMWLISVPAYLSHHQAYQSSSAPRDALWQLLERVAGRDLCLQEIVGASATACSLDVEVGLVVNGSLPFRLTSDGQAFSKGNVTFSDLARKWSEMRGGEEVARDDDDSVRREMVGVDQMDNTSSEEITHKTRARTDTLYFNQHTNNSEPFKFIKQPAREKAVEDIIVTSHSWEPIAEDDGNLFVYSAFYDDRPSSKTGDKRRVRVLAMSVTHELREFPYLREQVFCHFRWSKRPNLSVNQRGKIVSMGEDHDATYHGVFIICELNLCASPDYVGITVDRDVMPRSYLPVKYPPANGGRFQHNITVCLSVMHSRYSNKLELLQVFEADKILGAEKFTLYVRSASPEVLGAIKYYVSSGVLDAIEWRLPFHNASLVHYFGQVVALNDCLYQAMYSSRYVIFHDLDELLLPRLHDTWNLMMEDLLQEEASSRSWWRQLLGGHQFGSYIFLHVLFPRNWTHPGIPGDQVIEGSKVPVTPNSVQPFLVGHMEDRPSAVDEETFEEDVGVRLEAGETDKYQLAGGGGEGRGGGVLGKGEGGGRGGMDPKTKKAEDSEKNREKIFKKWRGTSAASEAKKLSEGKQLRGRTGGRSGGLQGGNKTQEKDSEARHNVRQSDPSTVDAQDSVETLRSQRRSNQLHKPSKNFADEQQHLDSSEGSSHYTRRERQQSAHAVSASDSQENMDPVSRLKPGRLLASDTKHSGSADFGELAALRYTWRENFVWMREWRSKMLVKPATVELMGIHMVHMHVKGFVAKDLPAHMGLVHHYRMWWVHNGTAMVRDTSALRLSSRLTSGVKNVLREIQLESFNDIH